MDKLFEILKKYNCNLSHKSIAMKSFLRTNYSEYISDLNKAISPSDNPVIRERVCNMVRDNIKKIEQVSNKIIQTLDLYEQGKIVIASNLAFEAFDDMEDLLIYQYNSTRSCYYRIRGYDTNDPFSLSRKDLFHVPFSKRFLVRTERYSMPGHPCLYLASSGELCWYECRKPSSFAISKFSFNQEMENYKFIDFSEKLKDLPTAFVSWFDNYRDNDKEIELIEKYLLKHICIYPLRAACSVIVEHPGASFIEEYIIPQLLVQWIINKPNIIGIKYESCSSDDEVMSLRSSYNVILITKEFDSEGYDLFLRKNVLVSSPCLYMIDTKNDKIASNGQIFNSEGIASDPFKWHFRSNSNDYEYI